MAREAGVRCVLFRGRVRVVPSGTEVHELSGGPGRARAGLESLGERRARPLRGAAGED